MKGEYIIDYLGMTGKNKHGTPFKIIEGTKASNLTIEFQDEYHYQMKTSMQNFKRGQVKNPYDKLICGVGYLGEGTHRSRHPNNGEKYREYKIWSEILRRCYSPKEHIRSPAYKDCSVCDEWLNYQNFATWYNENYYDIGEGRMHLDKDILIDGNRIYRPDACIFVPQRINMLFMHPSNKSGLPNGITKYSSGYRTLYNTKLLGIYSTLEEALENYMIEKKIHIKEVANEYKTRIPDKVYQALINW